MLIALCTCNERERSWLCRLNDLQVENCSISSRAIKIKRNKQSNQHFVFFLNLICNKSLDSHKNALFEHVYSSLRLALYFRLFSVYRIASILHFYRIWGQYEAHLDGLGLILRRIRSDHTRNSGDWAASWMKRWQGEGRYLLADR